MRTRYVAATIIFAFAQPVIAKQVSESDAAAAMYVARPVIERLFAATGEQTQKLLESALVSLTNTPSPIAVRDAALFDHIDSTFTSFGDESVALEVRLIEFIGKTRSER